MNKFIRPRQQQVDSGELASFEEVEVGDVTEAFGNVGHRFSTYERRGTSNDVAFEGEGSHLYTVHSDSIGLEDRFDGVG